MTEHCDVIFSFPVPPLHFMQFLRLPVNNLCLCFAGPVSHFRRHLGRNRDWRGEQFPEGLCKKQVVYVSSVKIRSMWSFQLKECSHQRRLHWRQHCIYHYVSLLTVPTGSPSLGGEIAVYVCHKQTELSHSFLFCSFVYFCLSGRFNCISFHKFSRQLSVFSLCSSAVISALLILSTIYLSFKISFNPDIIPWGWLGSKHQLANLLTY